MIDSAFSIDYIPRGSKIVDVGSGAGVPGLVVAALRPDCRLLLLDSAARKIRWALDAAQRLGLENVEGLVDRAEAAGRAPRLRARFDVALAKGVAPLRVLIEYALPLLRVGGLLVAHKGRDAAGEIEAAGPAAEALGGRIGEVRPYRLEGADADRHILLVEKIAETSDRYPRRAGTPAKRPL